MRVVLPGGSGTLGTILARRFHAGGDDVLVELGPDFRFQPEDTVYVCGSSGAVQRFGEVFRLPSA